jgi:hypothetical protein
LGLVRAGLPDSANRVAFRDRTRAAADPFKELVHIEAILRTWLHQKDEAFRLLRDYATLHPEWFNEDEWWFEDLWTDPRWRDLAAR